MSDEIRKEVDLNVILLHDQMVDKQGKLITSSLTMIDVHDLARSSRTFGVKQTFIAHPAPTIRKLARTLKTHWEEGFGSTYNPNRKDALEIIDIVSDLDEAIHKIELRTGKLPVLIATSAKAGENRIGTEALRKRIHSEDQPFLIMLGTGWGMCDELLARAQLFLEPICGPGDYNHLSVRSACAIMLANLMARR
jgi:hypothetical protein